MEARKIRPWILAAAGTATVLGILLVLAGRESRPSALPPQESASALDLGIPTLQEVRTLVRSYGERVGETETQLLSLREETARIRRLLEENETARRREREAEQDREEHREPPTPETPRVRRFDFEAPRRRELSVNIPAGSFGEATLLTGVYAPIQGEPLPVLIRLDAALVGPARSRIPIRGAFLVGKASGDANSERAVVQLQTLAYVTAEGRTVEVPVNGWVADADGIQGIRGTYVWRAEELTAMTASSGGLAGAAEALAGQETTSSVSPLGTTSTVTGDPLRFAGARGASKALERISEILERRMEEIVPAVHVINGKSVTIVFVTGAALEGMTRPEDSDGASSSADDGFDFDR